MRRGDNEQDGDNLYRVDAEMQGGDSGLLGSISRLGVD